jgi:hypothetical protein
MALCAYAKQHTQAQVETPCNLSILYDIYGVILLRLFREWRTAADKEYQIYKQFSGIELIMQYLQYMHFSYILKTKINTTVNTSFPH